MARKKYSAEFKVSVVLEVLKGEKSLNQIAQEHKVLPKNILNWKKQFLENAFLAFDKSVVAKEYKEEIEKLKKAKDATSKKLGEVIVERDWAVGKLKSLDLSTLVKQSGCEAITLFEKQCNIFMTFSSTCFI